MYHANVMVKLQLFTIVKFTNKSYERIKYNEIRINQLNF